MIVGYGLAILACLAVRPLWVDEVLQLIATKSAPSVRAMFESIRISVGAAPLGYLTQRPFVRLAGASAFWARFPSALCSVASCGLLLWICRKLRLSVATSALATGIFMIAPSQVRYAMEARPYAEALLLGLVAAVALANPARRPSIGAAVLAMLAVAAGLYTQTLIVFPLCGIALWYSVAALRSGHGGRAILPIACVGAAGALYAPWYLANLGIWHLHMQLSGYPSFHWTRALAPDVFKGISGGSIVCSAALLFLAAAGLRAKRDVGGLMACAAIFAIAGPLIEDSLQNYFFAARQILYAVPALAVLAGLGFEAWWRRSRMVAVAALAVFAAAALEGAVSYQMHAKENWRAAAAALADVTRDGYCLDMPVDSGNMDLYSVFEPSLASHTCADPNNQARVAFVSNFTMDPAQVNAAFEKFRAAGFVAKGNVRIGGTTIRISQRAPVSVE